MHGGRGGGAVVEKRRVMGGENVKVCELEGGTKGGEGSKEGQTNCNNDVIADGGVSHYNCW